MIKAGNILFIKLGEKGSFEKECIEINKSIKLGYIEIDHLDCINRNWDKVAKEINSKFHTVQSATTSHKNQIQKFYEEPSTTMWVTFYNSKLWYCFADTTIIINSDGTKERKTINGWSDKDIDNNTLFIQFLSGRLTQVQGFRGTICDVKEREYLLHKINNTQSTELVKVETLLSELKESIEILIKKLNPKDFEVFIDLIFRTAGWSRTGQLGSTIKDLDIQLVAPITNERAIVQIKSKSTLSIFTDYKGRFLNMNEYDKYFFVIHTPTDDLQELINQNTEKDIVIYDAKKISELCINAGLIEWLINVAK